MPDNSTPSPNAWDKQPDESAPAYETFCIYRDLGPKRTLIDAYRRHLEGRSGVDQEMEAGRSGSVTDAPGSWRKKFREFNWQARAVAWDNRLQGLQQKAVEAVVIQQATDQATRRAKHREEEWELGTLLMARAREMLAQPITQKVVKAGANGEIVTITVPAKWTHRTAVEFAKTASALRRMSADMPMQPAEPPPDISSKSILFKSPAQLADVIPPGAVPTMPEDPSVKPKPISTIGKGEDSKLIQPGMPVRP